MALKPLKNDLAFVCVIFTINVLLQIQGCQAQGDTLNILWKSSEVGRTLADTLKERARDSEGAVNNLDGANKIFRRISKAGAAAGTIFAFAGAFLAAIDNADERRHKELIKEFSDVKNGLSNIQSKMDKIIKIIKHEHAKTKGFESFAKVHAATKMLDNYNKNPEAYKDSLMRYLHHNDLYNALVSIYKLVNDADSIVKALYDTSRGSLGKINDYRTYVTGLLYSGHAVQATICTLREKDNGKSTEQARETCFDIKGDDFEPEEEKLNSKFDEYVALAKQKYKENIQLFMEEEFDADDFDLDNQDLATSIKEKLWSNFNWLDILVGVYNPVSGWDNHAIGPVQASKFRDRNGKKNWFVMANDRKNRPIYLYPKVVSGKKIKSDELESIIVRARCPGRKQENGRLLESSDECFDRKKWPERRLGEEDLQSCSCCSVENQKYPDNLWMLRKGAYMDARCYLNNLQTVLKINDVPYFGLAVIKKGRGLRIDSTNYPNLCCAFTWKHKDDFIAVVGYQVVEYQRYH